jgi:hypothetical protein
MKYLKSLSLGGLAALAVMAVLGAGAASASEPIVEAHGGFPVNFTGAGGAGTLQVTNQSTSVKCASSTSAGKISVASTVEGIQVHFKGCETEGGLEGLKCTTAGRAAGEITTNILHGTLVYLETNSPKTGILLSAAGHSAGTPGVFASFACGSPPFFGTNLEVTGTVLAELTNVNETRNTFTLHFYNDNAHPTPNTYLNNVGCGHVSTTEALKSRAFNGVLTFPATPSAVQGTQELTTSKTIKINATKCV